MSRQKIEVEIPGTWCERCPLYGPTSGCRNPERKGPPEKDGRRPRWCEEKYGIREEGKG